MSSRSRNPMLAAALAYADVDLPILPVIPGEKAPLTPHGYLDATIDPDVITIWWNRWPTMNIAMPTGPRSGWDVLDIDVSPDGTHGLAELDEAELTDLQRRRSHVVRTPSGGEHWYYPASGSGNGSIPGQHLDYRGHGGYVLLPPSTVAYPDGTSGPYTLASTPKAPETTSPIDWPALRSRLAPALSACTHAVPTAGSRSADERMDYLVRHVLATPEGNRNNALYWASCRAVENGSADLTPLIDAATKTGLTQIEAERTCASAQRTAAAVRSRPAASPASHRAARQLLEGT